MRREATAEAGARRFEVRSADGTSLAVWAAGQGPPLALVHGSLCDHTHFDPLVAELREHADHLTLWTAGGSGPAATRPATTSSGSSRTSPSSRRRSPTAPASRSRCSATPTGPAAPWVGRRWRRPPARPLRAGARHPLPARLHRGDRAAVAAGDLDTAARLVLEGIVELTERRWPPCAPARAGRGCWPAPPPCRGSAGPRTAGTTGPAGWTGSRPLPSALRVGDPGRPEGGDRAGRGGDLQRPGQPPGHAHLAHRTDPAVVAVAIRRFVLG